MHSGLEEARCSANDVVPVKPVSFALDMYVG